MSPDTAIGLDAPDAVMPPGDEITEYDVIGSPPSAGTAKDTRAAPCPATTSVIVGASGGPTGVAGSDGADDAPVPALFVAVTVNEYGCPFVRPDTVIGLSDPEAVMPLGNDVTVKLEIARPPSDAGAAKATCASPPATETDVIVGAPGTPVGVTVDDGADAGEVPALFCATTANVYATPSLSPETVSGLAAPVAVLPSGEEMTV